MQKPIKKATIVLWIIAGLMLIGTLANIGGEAGVVVSGLILTLIFAGIGFLISRKKKGADAAPAKAEQAKSAPATASASRPSVSSNGSSAEEDEVIKKFKVDGVSFDNKDNSSRQMILRHAYYGDHPYEDYETIIKEYEYNGDPAFGVYVTYTDDRYDTHAKQIGNIAAADLDYIVDNRFNFDGVEKLEIYGGDGKSWGACVYLRFMLKSGATGELDHNDVIFDGEDGV